MPILDTLDKPRHRRIRQAEFDIRIAKGFGIERFVETVFRDQVIGRGSLELVRHRDAGCIRVENLMAASQQILEDLYDALAQRCMTFVLYRVWEQLDRELQDACSELSRRCR